MVLENPPLTFGESLVFLVALLAGILDSIGGAAGAHGDNIGTSSIGISALNQQLTIKAAKTNFCFSSTMLSIGKIVAEQFLS